MAFTPVNSSLIGTIAADTLETTADSGLLSGITDVLGLPGDDDIAISGAVGSLSVRGGDGNDLISLGNTGATFVQGNADNDTISVGISGAKTSVYGGGGNDFITVSGGLVSSELRGGAGNDAITVVGAVSGDNTINGNEGDDLLQGENATGGVELRGGGGNDSVIGGSGNDTLVGGAGSNSVVGGAGNDLLEGGSLGTDVMLGGAGDDTITLVSGANKVFGNEGNDLIEITTPKDGFTTANSVDGGDGTDTLVIEGDDTTSVLTLDAAQFADVKDVEMIKLVSVAGVNAALTGSTAAGLQQLITTEADDVVDATGRTGTLLIQTGAGNDRIEVTTGDITVLAGAGDDLIKFSAIPTATDSVNGGDGIDTLSLTGVIDATSSFGEVSAVEALQLADADNRLVIDANAFASVFGGSGNDQVDASAYAIGLVLEAGAGNDNLIGSAQGDVIAGGADSDTIKGGLGADVLTGNTGTDWFDFNALDYSFAPTLIANTEAQGSNKKIKVGTTFTFGNGVDVVTDFNASEDKLLALKAVSQQGQGFSGFSDMIGTQTNTNLDGLYYLYGSWDGTNFVASATATDDVLIAQGIGSGQGSVSLSAATTYVVLEGAAEAWAGAAIDPASFIVGPTIV